jgi:hypothetical protein
MDDDVIRREVGRAMGSVSVDQLRPDGSVVPDLDVTLTDRTKVDLLLRHLPGAEARKVGSQRYVRFGRQAILYKQITYLGRPWEIYKKRIQIPQAWLAAHAALVSEGLQPRFVGIYHHHDVTIFVDFDPTNYLLGKANNSSAHVSTNDLHQALVNGTFTRLDKNDNRLTVVRARDFADYLSEGVKQRPFDPYFDILRGFNRSVLTGRPITVLEGVKVMHAAHWRNAFQGEWAGFYLEYLLDRYLRSLPSPAAIELVHAKTAGALDFDLRFRDAGATHFLGDLKASDDKGKQAPGNDAVSLQRALAEHGRFWYVIYEHATVKAQDRGDEATIAWNTWRRDAGHTPRSGFDPLSYAGRLKAEVTFNRMMVLEVNEANRHLVLSDFNQGKQQSGDDRALKVHIDKKDVENFILYGERLPPVL